MQAQANVNYKVFDSTRRVPFASEKNSFRKRLPRSFMHSWNFDGFVAIYGKCDKAFPMNFWTAYWTEDGDWKASCAWIMKQPPLSSSIDLMTDFFRLFLCSTKLASPIDFRLLSFLGVCGLSQSALLARYIGSIMWTARKVSQPCVACSAWISAFMQLFRRLSGRGWVNGCDVGAAHVSP